MNPAKLVPITLALLLAVPLMAALPACSKTEENRFLYVITGKVPDDTGALVYPTSSEPVAYGVLLVEPESSEEVVSVAVVPVVEPEPSSSSEPFVPYQVCEPYEWRGTIVPNCHWVWS